MPFRLGPMGLGLILLIVLIVFGAGKLPQIGGAFGKAIHSFREASRGEDGEREKAVAVPAEASKTSDSSQ